MTPTQKIRVLVAEDSLTARRLLVELLEDDPSIQVVGEARDGREAVEMTKRLRPSVVTMDVEMPHMDGFQATKAIMTEVPTPIVIISAISDYNQVNVSLNSLRLGAVAVITKPAGPGAPDFEADCASLVDTVKAMADVKVIRRRMTTGRFPIAPLTTKPRTSPAVAPEVIAIGTSTGGPSALHSILSAMPAEFPVPILIVQHIGVGFTNGLAAWLDSASPLTVKVAEEREVLRPGTAYIAPDDQHLGVTGIRVRLSDTPPVGGFRPSATHLFESVSQSYGSATLSVILTGMGADGLEGLRSVRSRGGLILAQDEDSSIVFGMPGVAIAAGVADEVVSLHEIAGRLSALTEKTM